MEEEATAQQADVYDPSKDPKRKAKSNDPGWKYGFWCDLSDKNKVECSLCRKQIKGGIKRFKQHLIGGFGDVVKCTKTSTEIAKEMNEVLLRNKKRPPIELDDYGDNDQEVESPIEVDAQQQHTMPSSKESTCFPSSGTASKRKKASSIIKVQPQVRGPMDAHLRRTPEEVVDERRNKGPTQTTLENRFRSAEDRERVLSHFGDFFYENGIPFNAVKSRSFEVLVESIGQYGPGLKPPSYHEMRIPILNSAKEKTENMRKEYEISWKKHGCTLMSDGWTDKRGRHLINFLINCPNGTYFMGSVDASSHIQDANMLFQLLDSKVEEIGEEYVVQVITDNAANYKAAGALLMRKRPKLFWTPCAAHCLDLMLEDIGKLKAYKNAIVKAKRVTTFIYRHTRLLDAMRDKTNGSDLVRSAVTRFATSFLTLQSIYKHKDALRQLFLCDQWKTSQLSTTEMGKKVAETIFSITFWNGVEDCLRASQPLLIVLRIVDGDERPAMPEVFMAMEEAKKKIKHNFGDKERLWKKVIGIIDRRWECQMEKPLYGAALLLNPGKYFEYSEKEPASVWKINEAFNDVLGIMVPDQTLQDKILEQTNNYKASRYNFAKPMGIRTRKTMNPIDWWSSHGGPAIELTSLAYRLLGLCCSSSGCERNWSTFEFIHTKKRNRLEHQRLNDLVYIQYNRRLHSRFKEMREKGRNYNPLLLDELDWYSEWMVNQPNEDLVHPDDDLTWRDVDRAIGASDSVDGRNLPLRSRVATTSSSRSVRRAVPEESSSDEGEEEEEHIAADDENVVDDFGLTPTNSTSRTQQGVGFQLDEDFD